MLLLMLLLLLHVSRDPEGDKDGARIREVVAAQFCLLDFHIKSKDWIGKIDSKESWIPSKNPICLTYSYFTSFHYQISTALPGMWGETVRPHGSELGEKGHKFDMISWFQLLFVWLICFSLLILQGIISWRDFIPKGAEDTPFRPLIPPWMTPPLCPPYIVGYLWGKPRARQSPRLRDDTFWEITQTFWHRACHRISP